MHLLKHLWPFAKQDRCTESAANEAAYRRDLPPSKRNRHGTLLGLLKPEKASTYDGITLRMLLTGFPITVKSLTRLMEAQLGNHTPNDVGASIRRVKAHLRKNGVRVHESDVKPERGARHKKHWLTADQIGLVQKMGSSS